MNIANDPIYGKYLNKLAESSKITSTTTTCDSKSFDNCQYKTNYTDMRWLFF